MFVVWSLEIRNGGLGICMLRVHFFSVVQASVATMLNRNSTACYQIIFIPQLLYLLLHYACVVKTNALAAYHLHLLPQAGIFLLPASVWLYLFAFVCIAKLIARPHARNMDNEGATQNPAGQMGYRRFRF